MTQTIIRFVLFIAFLLTSFGNSDPFYEKVLISFVGTWVIEPWLVEMVNDIKKRINGKD